ncbi:TIGR03086 family metal-binding protein [Blastococcus sp. SYSU D00669]
MTAGLPLTWDTPAGERTPSGRVRYRGPLAGADRPLHLHLGFDGAGPPFVAVPLERDDDGTWTGEVPGADGHLLLDGAVATEDGEWDNNGTADYRLWLGSDPVDSHVHARGRGLGPMGFDSLRVALASGGMTHGLVSWQDNAFVDEVAEGVPWLTRLVWVGPRGPDVDEVRRRLADGAAGLKFHPSYDEYPADSPLLDPFLRVAAEAGVPATVHTAPGPSDPDLVRRLAERHPDVPFVLYHTFLGFPEGRRRAARHAQQLPNLHLETSWCRSAEVELLIEEVGPDRVLFGSDAAVDGPTHYVRTPPNVELTETYNGGLLRLARRLPAETLRALLEGNTRRLFGLPAPWPPEPGVRELFSRALATAQRVVEGVAPDQLRRVTPCAGWDVEALIRHLVATVQKAGRVAGSRRRSRPGAEWAAQFAAAARAAEEAWADDEVAEGDLEVAWGLLPAPAVLSGLVLELVVHAHDLAVATGRVWVLDDGLAVPALRIAERLVPATLRGRGAAFAAPVPVPVGADDWTRLAAFLGRTP